ncbi:MAG: hypothetical protein HC908_05450 [Calothrix sp. SM1_7_51]|nr:hypothetical protein [Calothrix sp. SM1_7_51]
MTPTLIGRWQTRLLLLGTVGLLFTLPFITGLVGTSPSLNYLFILFYVAIFGLGWDAFYNHLQKYRWDRDWPAAYQLFAGIWEMLFIWFVISWFGLPFVRDVLWVNFFPHYTTVWIAVFITSQSLMRIIFPRWRLRGGKWL